MSTLFGDLRQRIQKLSEDNLAEFNALRAENARLLEAGRAENDLVLSLRAENAELNAKLDTILTDKDYEGGVQYWINKHDEMVLTCIRLVSENVELKADKERLDWLESKHYLVDFNNKDAEPTDSGYWHCTDGYSSGIGDTIRAAIDQAKGTNEPKP